MQVTDDSAASDAEQVAHARPAVERWFIWSGLLPLPVFVLLHVCQQLARSLVNDVADVVRPTASLFGTLTSLLLVWLPLTLHVVLGAWFLLSGRPRASAATSNAGDLPRVARVLSRVGAVLALAFVAQHGYAYAVSIWLGHYDARDAGFRLLAELSSTHFGVPVMGGLYLLGLLATATHAGIGVHRGLLALGKLPSFTQRRASARACAAFGALLFGTGALAVIRVASGVLLR